MNGSERSQEWDTDHTKDTASNVRRLASFLPIDSIPCPPCPIPFLDWKAPRQVPLANSGKTRNKINIVGCHCGIVAPGEHPTPDFGDVHGADDTIRCATTGLETFAQGLVKHRLLRNIRPAPKTNSTMFPSGNRKARLTRIGCCGKPNTLPLTSSRSALPAAALPAGRSAVCRGR